MTMEMRERPRTRTKVLARGAAPYSGMAMLGGVLIFFEECFFLMIAQSIELCMLCKIDPCQRVIVSSKLYMQIRREMIR